MIKIIFALLLVISISVFAQNKNHSSIQQLENQISLTDLPDAESPVNISPDNSKKSVGLGILYSLLLPGMGELYSGSYGSGKYFTIADGVLWGTFIGMSVYGSWQEENYKSYAETHAGVNNENKDEAYYATISEYNDIESYNDEKALERNFGEMYKNESYFWKWNSNEERRTYRDMWTSSEQVNNDIRFVVGGLILNRIASAINAARLIVSYNKSLQQETSWNVSVGFQNRPNLPTSLALNFQTSF
jgi:hypothetical protein